MYLNENQFETVPSTETTFMALKRKTNPDGSRTDNSLLGLLNFGSMALSFFIISFYFYNAYKENSRQILINKRAFLDIGFSLLNIVICISIYAGVLYGGADDLDERSGSHYLRWLQAFAAIVIWAKSLYFMQVIDDMAPLVHIIYKVFSDIKYFVCIMIVVLGAFANAFYLMGKNQVQFDEIESKDDYPIYYEIRGSIQYIYLLSLGEIFADDANFSKGNKNQQTWLWILFILATFIIIVTMMNMLIAIMGDTFVNNSEVAEQNTIKQHL